MSRINWSWRADNIALDMKRLRRGVKRMSDADLDYEMRMIEAAIKRLAFDIYNGNSDH